MPERPELEYVVPILDRELRGLEIAGVRVRKPVVLRLLVAGTPDRLLLGRRFDGVTRRAHFVLFALAGTPPLELVVHPMLAGRFALSAAADRAPADLALGLQLGDGREPRYRDDVQMGKVYLVAPSDRGKVPGLSTIGVDVLDPTLFTIDRFLELARRRRDQVKVFLLDKSVLDAMGNAYADEVLWAARIHPKAMVRKLSDDELVRLHGAIVEVLRNGRDEVARRQLPIDEKVRDFLEVRGREGQPCRRCGSKLRRARVHADDSIFCPACQPDSRGSSIVDWRKLS